jgi:hypothetical protein
MRNLARAEEGFFADRSRYGTTADTGSTAGKINFTPSNGNTGLTLVASTTDWSAFVSIPGTQKCGIFTGTAARPAGMAATNPAGAPVCR